METTASTRASLHSSHLVAVISPHNRQTYYAESLVLLYNLFPCVGECPAADAP